MLVKCKILVDILYLNLISYCQDLKFEEKQFEISKKYRKYKKKLFYENKSQDKIHLLNSKVEKHYKDKNEIRNLNILQYGRTMQPFEQKCILYCLKASVQNFIDFQ